MLNKKSNFYSICLVLIISLFTANYSQENKNRKNLVHFGDLIDIDVVGSTEFDWRGTLTPEGLLDGVDFVDEPIYALCQSEETIAAKVAKGYEKILRNPKVIVKILDRSGRAVSYLYGAVIKPQRFQIEREIRLNELLILSGGVDEKASGEIQIIRTNKLNCEEETNKTETTNLQINQREVEAKTIKINISDLIKGQNESNPLILNGDIITVSEAEPIYIIGGVSNPRKINARSQMTVLRAIASAGGLSKNADVNNIVIYRRNKNENQRIEVFLDKIKENQIEDIVLRKFDILEVGIKGGGKRQFSPVVKVLEWQTKPLELPLRIID